MTSSSGKISLAVIGGKNTAIDVPNRGIFEGQEAGSETALPIFYGYFGRQSSAFRIILERTLEGSYHTATKAIAEPFRPQN